MFLEVFNLLGLKGNTFPCFSYCFTGCSFADSFHDSSSSPWSLNKRRPAGFFPVYSDSLTISSNVHQLYRKTKALRMRPPWITGSTCSENLSMQRVWYSLLLKQLPRRRDRQLFQQAQNQQICWPQLSFPSHNKIIPPRRDFCWGGSGKLKVEFAPTWWPYLALEAMGSGKRQRQFCSGGIHRNTFWALLLLEWGCGCFQQEGW